jgi:hypothetical protein
MTEIALPTSSVRRTSATSALASGASSPTIFARLANTSAIRESIEDGAFTYVWEQKSYHPATNHMECRIHFEFPDGSRIKNAFRYSWRLYSIPELRDVLTEVGYREVRRTYFEEFDEDGDGTGHFARNEEGEACEGWLAYLVAVP